MAGTRLIYCNVHNAFRRLVRLAGLTPRSTSCRPRIQDLRHTFAVRSMLYAYAAGQDGQMRLTFLSTWLGHVHPGSTYWYESASPELMSIAVQRIETHLANQSAGRPKTLAPTLQAFFTDRLTAQRHASGHTIAAYRDTLRLLLGYATQRTGIAPSQLDLADLDAPLIAAFLDHLETKRGNSVRTRNARLAAIHSLFRFAALNQPEHSETIARVLAISPKRFDRALVTHLTEPEVDALLAACDQATWTGRRDLALLLLTVQTGLRVSELIGLTRTDRNLGAGPHVARRGKAARTASPR